MRKKSCQPQYGRDCVIACLPGKLPLQISENRRRLFRKTGVLVQIVFSPSRMCQAPQVQCIAKSVHRLYRDPKMQNEIPETAPPPILMNLQISSYKYGLGPL
ncbi:hypothetical protein N7G274_004653 [Stereocaulon virgatum]|uniref:Uncharacterized protein n=1 Tax=Stereocaulon virgatum TaxID=373712 RepID=A0ABR4AHK7_9LECA